MSKEAMKLALEVLTGNWRTEEEMNAFHDKQMQAITALREALAEQPAQQERGCLCKNKCIGAGEMWQCRGLPSVLAEQPAQQEPVPGVVIREGLPTLLRDRDIKPTDARLHTSPQAQRPWVGLTDEEVAQRVAMLDDRLHLAFYAGMYQAQQILKEKNQ